MQLCRLCRLLLVYVGHRNRGVSTIVCRDGGVCSWEHPRQQTHVGKVVSETDIIADVSSVEVK